MEVSVVWEAIAEMIPEQEQDAVPEQLPKSRPKAMVPLMGAMVRVIQKFTGIELSIRYWAVVRVVLRQRGEPEPAGAGFG
jgi:hypothetical protein